MYMVFIMMHLMPRHNFRLTMKICFVAHNFYLKETAFRRGIVSIIPATALVVSVAFFPVGLFEA
jgi:hypothetical protein